MPPRIVHLGNNTFVTWSLTDLTTKMYFIIQFSINFTTPHPSQLLSQHLKGTVQHVNLTQEDIFHKLKNIEPLNERESKIVLKNAISNYGDNDASIVNGLEAAEDIFSLVLHANVTGLLLKNFTHLKLRVLLITSDNEYLAQDLRYVEWKTVSIEFFVKNKIANVMVIRILRSELHVAQTRIELSSFPYIILS